MDNNELMHHGILGMRWGIRRYQNKDGSLTPAGKRRVKTGEIGETTESSNNYSPRKSVKEMSDAELRDNIARLELEKRYSDLASPKEQVRTNKGKSFIMDVLEKSAKNIATQTVTYVMGSAVNSIAKNMGVKNATRTVKNEDGKETVEKIYENIVNPRKGQKDK